MPASIARSNAGMPEERVIVTAVTLPSEVCNFTWYSAVGFSAPLREASDKPRPAARRHGLWRHSPRRGRRIRRSGCGRRCRPMPAAPSASLRKASLRALSAAAFWRPLPWPSSRRRPSRRRPFSRGLFGGGLLGGVFLGLLLGGDLSAAAFSAAALSAAALSAAWRSCSRRFFSFSSACLRSSSRRAFSLAASAASRAFSSSSRFLACCSAISGSTSDLGGWTLGSGGGGEDPAASAARVPVAAWAEAGVWAVRAWAAANGRIAVRPELHFHRAGRFRAPVQVEDQHGQQQRVHQQGQKQGFPVVSVGRRGRGRCGVE